MEELAFRLNVKKIVAQKCNVTQVKQNKAIATVFDVYLALPGTIKCGKQIKQHQRVSGTYVRMCGYSNYVRNPALLIK
jgi:endonuclease I